MGLGDSIRDRISDQRPPAAADANSATGSPDRRAAHRRCHHGTPAGGSQREHRPVRGRYDRQRMGRRPRAPARPAERARGRTAVGSRGPRVRDGDPRPSPRRRSHQEARRHYKMSTPSSARSNGSCGWRRQASPAPAASARLRTAAEPSTAGSAGTTCSSRFRATPSPRSSQADARSRHSWRMHSYVSAAGSLRISRSDRSRSHAYAGRRGA